ncbi:hypothetical protein, partial [Vibrio parahaemolyticus]|uniref:hypothetical protein n=1 Tax=Vibrio parahaemolyticus TaxID=670 RepID=UPI000AC681FB
DIASNFPNGQMSESLIEFIAERDEELLSLYLESEYDEKIWLERFQSLIATNQIYPVLRVQLCRIPAFWNSCINLIN